MSVENRKLPLDQFFKLRSEVLETWPTGKDVDLEDAIAYHKQLPVEKIFSQKLKAAKSTGDTLLQPRAGVALPEEHIELLQYLEKEGEADLLPTTIDS
ncbi:MAG TPA: methylaspartate mutase subunit E, partial [Bacillota bacterium]|nr:methylaspartate mutase subunit E [Bacillota bacterium]